MILASIPKQFITLPLDLIIFLTLFSALYLLFNFQFQNIIGDIGTDHIFGWNFPIHSGFFYLTIWAGWTVFIITTEVKSGQSFGKRFLKIKIQNLDSNSPDLHNIIIRHLFEVINFALLLGCIVFFTNIRKQRIGDLMAQTIVVEK